MGEFDIIAKYFRPLTGGDPLQDDATVLNIPDGHELVVTSDTLNAGTHFLNDEDPANIAHKALRTNLSDLAAMGANPLCYQLNLAFPEKPSEDWLQRFTKALETDQKQYGLFCSGGDTTSILGGHLSISITALGTVPKGKALHRNGAKEGDLIIITGPVGDAFLGLKSLQTGLEYPAAISRYRLPHPRLQSTAMRDHIHAAADISDGLVADLGHIAAASGLAADIHLDRFRFSGEVQSAFAKNLITPEQALTGGDDYELVLAVAPEHEKAILAAFPEAFPEAFVIGRFAKGQGVRVLDEKDQPVSFTASGWSHF